METILKSLLTQSQDIVGGDIDVESLSIDSIQVVDSSRNFQNIDSLVVGGSTINSSSLARFDSTTKGVLLPRMTQTQKLAIVSPFAGLIVYDTTLNCLSYHNGTNWFIPSWLNFKTSLSTQCVSSPGAVVVWNTFSKSPDDRITSITGLNFTVKDIGRYEINVSFHWSQANSDGSEARASASFGYYQGAVLSVSTDQVIVTDGITSSGSASMTYFLDQTIENESYEFRTYSASGGAANQYCELTSSSTGFIRRIL
jgi:hypothetical protein